MKTSNLSPQTLLANRLAQHYAEWIQVESVSLGGSQSTYDDDIFSDIDLYVYTSRELPLDVRMKIATAQAADPQRVEVGNEYWEPGDEFVDADTGIHVDVIFRPLDWATEQIRQVLIKQEASLGYSTCIWHNILEARILWDRNGRLKALQQIAQRPYPERLKQAIVEKNYPVLASTYSSYLHQIELAVKRNDFVSIQHRVTALLASYFDIIFALNKLPHSGEKRILDRLEDKAQILPREMRLHVISVLTAKPNEIIERVNTLLNGLDEIL